VKKIIIICLLALSFGCKIKNNKAFISGSLWPDTSGEHINAHGGGFLIYNDSYYWFGEHKIAGKFGNRAMVGVRVYSSKDLYNWKNEGVALHMKKDTTSKLQYGSTLERPKVIFNKKTKKFVMWFHHELKGESYKAALTGVAVSDNVIGPYEYIDSFRIHAGILPQNFSEEDFKNAPKINNRKDKNWKEKVAKGAHFVRDFKGGQMSRDMTLFVDDDQTAYHITASEENQTLLISKLSDDYLSLTDKYVRVLPSQRNEASAIFKKDGKYYMFSSGLTGWKPNPARLSVTNKMLGEWTSLGNPVVGSEKEKATTFESQSTYIIPVIGKKDAYIFVADRWRPKNPIDGRYVWLPVLFNDNGVPYLKWQDKWDLSVFE
tara:strand:+ start:1245 stop:2369 length:1125 start_codon:yes stop_codon:yes gene_type:complete